MNAITGIVKTMRPRQMLMKNGVVFAALIFAQKLRGPEALNNFKLVLFAYAAFALVSGAVYLFNDVLDVDQDRLHPVKKNRPIPSGALPIPAALATSIILGAIAITAAFLQNTGFGVCLAAYALLNLLYSGFLKHVVIVDVMCISLGFVLRVAGGAVVIPVEVSKWLVLCSLLLSLFIGFSKRRHELTILGDGADGHRKILGKYTPNLLDQIIAVVTSSTLVAYMLYTMDKEVLDKLHTQYLWLTIPFVLYGIFRYLYITHFKEDSGNPTRAMLTDAPILINIGLWVAMVVILLYTSWIKDIAAFLFPKI